MRLLVVCVTLLASSSALAQTPPTLELSSRQGNYNWVIETASDGSRRGGWVPVGVALEDVERSGFKPLPPLPPIALRPEPVSQDGLTVAPQVTSSATSATSAEPRSSSRSARDAQVLEVQIVDRHISGATYSYVVPGHVTSRSDSTAHCFGGANTVNCSGSTTAHATIAPPTPISYDVRGATFSLRLPDGRIAVVNCGSKYALKFDHINRRSCRMPLSNQVRVAFDGDKATLVWPVSLDGRKMASETYQILAVLDPQ